MFQTTQVPGSLPVNWANSHRYSGRTTVDRLVQIISLCPEIAPQALALAADHIYKLRDPNLYQLAVSAYEQASSVPGVQLPPFLDIAPLNQIWLDETASKNQSERAKLEVELKTYTSNMIKESIRVRHLYAVALIHSRISR